jgi:anionic cell wall polymer biosynthesis LytR-Cps2A-Psr (LCP) family protein
LVDGVWGRVAGASDFSRQSHQHDVLMQLFSKMSSFGSLGAVGEVAQQLANSAQLDSAFSIGDAVSLAWSYRNVDGSSLKIVRLSYEDYRTTDGAQVLLPSITFSEALTKVYPAAG